LIGINTRTKGLAHKELKCGSSQEEARTLATNPVNNYLVIIADLLAAERATNRSPVIIGTEPCAYIEMENHATFFHGQHG